MIVYVQDKEYNALLSLYEDIALKHTQDTGTGLSLSHVLPHHESAHLCLSALLLLAHVDTSRTAMCHVIQADLPQPTERSYILCMRMDALSDTRGWDECYTNIVELDTHEDDERLGFDVCS